jgi:hypothetical protein
MVGILLLVFLIFAKNAVGLPGARPPKKFRGRRLVFPHPRKKAPGDAVDGNRARGRRRAGLNMIWMHGVS